MRLIVIHVLSVVTHLLKIQVYLITPTVTFSKCFLFVIFHCSNKSGKSGVISMPNTGSGIQTKDGRVQNETILYPCVADSMQDSRVMWATLTPRGTTRHYLEEHTYETIGGGQFHKRACTTTPTEHVKLKAI